MGRFQLDTGTGIRTQDVSLERAGTVGKRVVSDHHTSKMIAVGHWDQLLSHAREYSSESSSEYGSQSKTTAMGPNRPGYASPVYR